MTGSPGQHGPAAELGHLSSKGVTFKGGRRGLRLVLPCQVGFQEVLADLRQKLGESGDFFRGARVHLDQGQRLLLPDELQNLRSLLQEHGLQMVVEEAVPAEPPPEPTLTVRTPVRSGQRVQTDGNVLILGDVHAGAEISAGRDVIVMGTARGIIAAGLISGREAQVFAFALRPALLRLGDLAARNPGTGPAWRAEVARVRDERIIVEPYLGWPREKTRKARKG